MSQGELSFRRPGAPPAGGAKPKGGTRVLGVTEVVRGVNRLLETRFGLLCIEGEVSGLKIGGSGHAYFNLKDRHSTLPVAMWRSSLERMQFDLADGQSVRVFGRVGIFVKNAKFQFYAERAEPAGLGARMLELEAIKQRLEADGLFAQDRKRPLPSFPRRIGVVTSAHGAAVHDIIKVARRRCASRIVLSPAVVQGEGASASLRVALRRVLAVPGVDVVIIGRGGGSAEDLWAFNDERLARAIADAPVPVVSAVGHEVDVSVSDLVADLRAATPSHAAELVVPDRDALATQLQSLLSRSERAIERASLGERARLEQLLARLGTRGRKLCAVARSDLRGQEARLAVLHPRVAVRRKRERLDAAVGRLRALGHTLSDDARDRQQGLHRALADCGRALGRSRRSQRDALEVRLRGQGRKLVSNARARFARAAGAMGALSPLAVLERGYAVVTGPDGRALTQASDASPGELLAVRLHRGTLRVRTLPREPEE